MDEVSFASFVEIKKLNSNLNQLMKKNKLRNGYKYGGLHIVYSGDFRQLEPIGIHNKKKKKPLYDDTCIQFNSWINCFLELNGKHRFREDPAFGAFLIRMRDGIAVQRDFDWINERVLVRGETRNGDVLPADVKYCTYYNRDRDAINAALFSKRCSRQYREHGNTDDCMIIFCDDLQAKNGSKVYQPFPNHSYFYENVGEANCDPGKYGVGRLDGSCSETLHWMSRYASIQC